MFRSAGCDAGFDTTFINSTAFAKSGTCFSGTKVHILTLHHLHQQHRFRQNLVLSFTCFTGTKAQILTLRAAGVRALAPWSKEALDQLKKWSEKTETKRFRGNCDSKVGAKEVKAAQKAVIEAKYAADIASAAAHAAGAQFYHLVFFITCFTSSRRRRRRR